jgi:NAD-reducing hydrogenase small subunit
MEMSNKLKLATVWLDVAEKVELVYSPLVDPKEFPEMADLTLVEGAVSSQDDLEKIKKVRAHTRILVALGDCAVTANVPSMRNPFGVEAVIKRACYENVSLQAQTPSVAVPALLKRVRPIHDVVTVDVHVPGCPPSADSIFAIVAALIEGQTPDVASLTRFGA